MRSEEVAVHEAQRRGPGKRPRGNELPLRSNAAGKRVAPPAPLPARPMPDDDSD